MTSLGPWQVTDGTHRFTAEAPFDVISSLHSAGAIPDPYWGRNEYDLRWIAERDWEAHCQFELPDVDRRLVLSGLDGVVEVVVNGQVALLADNAFRTWRIDLSDYGRVGLNDVVLRFRSVVREVKERADALPWPIPSHPENGIIPHGNLLRKQQCDFGWDWNIALAPFGLTGEVRIEVGDPPGHLAIRQRMDAGRMVVSCDWAVTGDRARFSLCGVHADVPIRGGMASAELVIDNPQLWWPNGQGDQPLFDLVAEADHLTLRRRIGLCVIELVSNPDAYGRSFGFRVNGRDVFAKGANWVPADALAGRITQDAVRDLLQSARDAHMNMIRVWGGGRYEPDWFYDLCDEMGLMVWQDAMFACHLYPADDDFLMNVASEVAENTQRIAHHPCLALWCGDNELIGAMNWYEESRADRDRYLVSYDRLNRSIETAVRAGDPGANWWPSSPSPGPLSFGDAWHDDSSGDMHFWSVWHEGRDFDHFRDVKPRFCSEFGFQSYPSLNAIRHFADERDWNIAAPVFEAHQKNAGGNARIAETMFRYFRFPQRFEDFVYLSQVQQGLAVKTAVEHWRSLKPHCQGTLFWQLNDTWPVCSWSSLDHGGDWKLLHHMAKGFYRPVLVTIRPSTEGFDVVAVNDRPEPIEIDLTVYATAMDGSARDLATARAVIGASAETVLSISQNDVKPNEVLTYGWTGSDGTKAGDIFNPNPWKTYDLIDPSVQCEVVQDAGVWRVKLRASAMAFFLSVEADQPGRWSRNAIHIGPGAETELVFTPRDESARPKFTVRHLYSATYGEAA